jgi:hypothetical protein
LPTHNAKQKKQKSHQANAQRHCKMTRQKTTEEEERTANTGLAKVAVQCSADTFVVNQTLVLRINICGENRHLRQARNRYVQYSDD